MRAIARRSKAYWGSEQGAHYTASLDAAFNRLASYPELGREHSEIEAGLRVLPVKQHLVLYQIVTNGVLVLRVVHQRMDLRRVAIL